MRVIIDTNLLVSYLLTHRGPIQQILDVQLARQDFTLLICVTLLEELERVLQYDKLRRFVNDENRMRFIALIASLGELVDIPDDIPSILRDPKDDYLIACALAGNADFIVSGDKDLLDAKLSVKALTASNFLEHLPQ
jgi:putative PIN family toxin of toxin-antitoxin system